MGKKISPPYPMWDVQNYTLFATILIWCISGGFYVWPGLAEVNTRARRYVSTWIRHQKREETKQAYLQKVCIGEIQPKMILLLLLLLLLLNRNSW